MKLKYFLLSISLILISCNSINISENSSIMESSDTTNSLNVKNNLGKYLYYYRNIQIEENLFETVEVLFGSIKNYFDDLPDFILAGDNIRMNYYGEIIPEDVPLDTPNLVDYWTLEGDIVSLEYISAQINKVECNVGYYQNGNKYFEVDDTKFEFIILDKEYHFCSVSDFEINQELYASYYEGVPKALYSFNPLL